MSKSAFKTSLEKATSKLLLSPDWDSNLQLCDMIRGGDIKPGFAIGEIKKKVESDNPHVCTLGLDVLEMVVKNCGSPVHSEVTTREFMEFIKDLARAKAGSVQQKILGMIQVWAKAIGSDPRFKAALDTYNIMKLEGVYSWPAVAESDVMFESETAPQWKDDKESDSCHRCRTGFGILTRRHHCRACGLIFCHDCSSKESTIPKFGIEKMVRVCDACFGDINRGEGPGGEEDESGLPHEYMQSALYRESQEPQQKPDRREEDEEEFQLQLALAMSQSEAESKKPTKRSNLLGGPSGGVSSSAGHAPVSHPPPTTQSYDTSDMDPELARYLDRPYWDQKGVDQPNTGTSVSQQQQPAQQQPAGRRRSPSPSAPILARAEDERKETAPHNGVSNGESDAEVERFTTDLRQLVQMFGNRMRSNQQRNRPIATDPTVQSLFLQISELHPRLRGLMDQYDDRRTHWEEVQDKLVQIRDARDALDALRAEQAERRRREAAEQERLRQVAMMQKLEVLRQQKQVMLEAQRQQMLQRLQQQEEETARRMAHFQHMQQQQRAQQVTKAFPQAFVPPGMDPQQAYSMPPGGMGGYMPPHMMPGGHPPPPQGMAPGQGGPGMYTGPQGAPGVQHPAPHMQHQHTQQQPQGYQLPGPPQQPGAPGMGPLHPQGPPQQHQGPPQQHQGPPQQHQGPPQQHQGPPQPQGAYQQQPPSHPPGQQHPMSGQQGVPQMSGPGGPGPHNAFVMQGMAGSLPPINQQQQQPPPGPGQQMPPQGGPPPPQQHYMPGAPPHPYPPSQAPGQPPVAQAPNNVNQNQHQGPPPGHEPVGQLISFD